MQLKDARDGFDNPEESGNCWRQIPRINGAFHHDSGRIRKWQPPGKATWKYTPDTKKIVDKAWNFAHVLRDDGLSYMAYTEQITFLLFLKMADEQTRPPYNRTRIVPTELG